MTITHKTAVITIYEQEEDGASQDVRVEYCITKSGGAFWSEVHRAIIECVVMDEIVIDVYDLKTDILEGIILEEGMYIPIQCRIELNHPCKQTSTASY